jgi:hypothetical protein
MNYEHLSVLTLVGDQSLEEKLKGYLFNFSIFDVGLANDFESFKTRYLDIFPHVLIIEASVKSKILDSFLSEVKFNGIKILISKADEVFKLRQEIKHNSHEKNLVVALPVQPHDLYEKIKKACLYLKDKKIEFQVLEQYGLPKIEAHFDLPLHFISESKLVIESPIRLDPMRMYFFKSRLVDLVTVNCKMMVVGVSTITQTRSFYISLYLRFLGEEILKKIRQKVAV